MYCFHVLIRFSDPYLSKKVGTDIFKDEMSQYHSFHDQKGNLRQDHLSKWDYKRTQLSHVPKQYNMIERYFQACKMEMTGMIFFVVKIEYTDSSGSEEGEIALPVMRCS